MPDASGATTTIGSAAIETDAEAATGAETNAGAGAETTFARRRGKLTTGSGFQSFHVSVASGRIGGRP